MALDTLNTILPWIKSADLKFHNYIIPSDYSDYIKDYLIILQSLLPPKTYILTGFAHNAIAITSKYPNRDGFIIKKLSEIYFDNVEKLIIIINGDEYTVEYDGDMISVYDVLFVISDKIKDTTKKFTINSQDQLSKTTIIELS